MLFAGLVIYLGLQPAPEPVDSDLCGPPPSYWMNAFFWAYLLGGAIMIAGPAAAGAGAFAGERRWGTLQSLLLTPLDRRALCLGRWWNITRRWLCMLAWMTPVYLAMARGFAVFEPLHNLNSGEGAGATLIATGPRPLAAALLWLISGEEVKSLSSAGLFLVVRIGRDCLTVALSAAIGCWVGVRRGWTLGAGIIAGFLSAGLMATLFNWPSWISLLFRIFMSGDSTSAIYAIAAALGIAFEVLVIRWLMNGTARGFDVRALKHV